MKKTTLVLVSALISGGAFAAEEPRVYVSPEVGIVSSSSDCVPGDTCDFTGLGIGLVGGINITDNLGLELGYLRASGFSVSRGSREQSQTLSTFKVGGKARLDVSDNFNLVGRAGVHKWELEVSEASVSASDGGLNPYFGGGLQYQVSNSTLLEASITRYILDEELTIGRSTMKFDETVTAFTGALVFEL